MSEETYAQRLARLDATEQRVVGAAEALAEVLEDLDLGAYEPYRQSLLDALNWLELESTCGDCVEGRCHYGGARSDASIAAARAGEEYDDPEFGPCGCARHEVSVDARQRRARLEAAGITRAAQA